MRRWWWVLWAVVVGAVALGLRWQAVAQLPIDYDEDDYLLAAQQYAVFLRAGDGVGLSAWDYNYEHPPLSKLIYGAVLVPLPPATLVKVGNVNDPPARRLPQPQFEVVRTTAALLGAGQALALALVSPLAGLWLAIHTWQIKYTAQIMLEAPPALFSTLSMLAYTRWRRQGQGAGWLALSALFLGLTAAAKYMYCIAGVAMALDWALLNLTPRPALADAGALREPGGRGQRWWPLLAWGVLALAVFFVANPRLWHDPLPRLAQSLLYHGDYAQSQHVQDAGYPVWQPFVWLSGSVPWHPGVFVFSVDLGISLLAVLGAGRLWQRDRAWALWLGLGLAFLTAWNTKWPQYILMLTTPLCLAAAHGFTATLGEPLWARWAAFKQSKISYQKSNTLLDAEAWRAYRWIAPGAVIFGLLLVFPLVYQLAMALTDFNALSFRDGLQGGVWREVGLGLTGQVPAQPVVPFARNLSREVHYAGWDLLLRLLSGAVPDLLFFNVMWMVLAVTLQTGVGLGAALLLARPEVKGAKIWQAILILPWAIPEFIGALIWLRIFEPRYGWFNQAMPLDLARYVQASAPPTSLLMLLVAATWGGFPLIMLAASAGLKLIPREVWEAAALDGAVGWTKFREVTWPLLWPLLAPAVLIRAIWAFNQFYLFNVMRSQPPLLTFAAASYFVFSGPGGGQFAVSAALNVFTVVVLTGLLAWFLRRSRAAEAA